MEGKLRYFIAKPAADDKLDFQEIDDPHDPRLEDDPDLTRPGGAGTLKFQNGDETWMIITVGEAAHKLAERTFRDIAALVQEHEPPN